MQARRVALSEIADCQDQRLDAEHYVHGHRHRRYNKSQILSVERVSLSDVPWYSSDLAPVLKDIEALPEGQALRVTANTPESARTLRNRIQNACNLRGIPVRTSGKQGDAVFHVFRGRTKRQRHVKP